MEMSAPELSASMKPYEKTCQHGRNGCIQPVMKLTDFCTRLGDCAEVVDKVGLCHTDTGITDGEDLVLLVGGDADVEVLTGLEDGGVGEGRIADFVDGIGAVRDEFTKEDLLVAVEGVCEIEKRI